VSTHQYFVFDTVELPDPGSAPGRSDGHHFGFCAIAWNDVGITRFVLPSATRESAEHNVHRRITDATPGTPHAAIVEIVNAAKRYFAGEPIDFTQIRVDLAGQDPLFAKIYEALRRIGYGKTTTYGGLAKDIGAGPEIARNVGQAMAKNPVPLIIPCHRVLAAGNKLGGFSAPGGTTTKVRMLELEGVRIGPAETAQQSLGF
jgi:methylated-DNA-[protein]-cysteine S-methyltransferase